MSYLELARQIENALMDEGYRQNASSTARHGEPANAAQIAGMSALVVAPDWWPGQPFLVVKTEEEREALIEEGEAPGMIWTLPEARKLAGLKPEEKLDLARVKVEFNGQIGRVRSLRSGDGQI